ncbi:hypothetical protein CSPAE12_00400, partial [Colletotrichum incanum]
PHQDETSKRITQRQPARAPKKRSRLSPVWGRQIDRTAGASKPACVLRIEQSHTYMTSSKQRHYHHLQPTATVHLDVPAATGFSRCKDGRKTPPIQDLLATIAQSPRVAYRCNHGEVPRRSKTIAKRVWAGGAVPPSCGTEYFTYTLAHTYSRIRTGRKKEKHQIPPPT